MGDLKIRLKTLSELGVYALVDVMLHFVLFGAFVCALDTSAVLTSATILIEITPVPGFNNSDLIVKELPIWPPSQIMKVV